MREVFKPETPLPDVRDEVFYTITSDDVDRQSIATTVGGIRVSEVMGRVLQSDVGKRVYRIHGTWWAESDQHRDNRMTGKGQES